MCDWAPYLLHFSEVIQTLTIYIYSLDREFNADYVKFRAFYVRLGTLFVAFF